MGLSNIIRSAAGRFAGGGSAGTTRRTPRTGGMRTGRSGANRPGSGGVGGMIRSILNRR